LTTFGVRFHNPTWTGTLRHDITLVRNRLTIGSNRLQSIPD